MPLESEQLLLDTKIIHPADLEVCMQSERERGNQIVTINGSFDLLHPGHLYMFSEAAACGDVLLVLLNSDASIQKYKSPDRPINPLKVRLQMVAALENVTYVSWFDETDPRAILEKVHPHVHVNGVEYGENCIEADVVKKHGGRIHLVDAIPGYSSTNIINRIKKLCD